MNPPSGSYQDMGEWHKSTTGNIHRQRTDPRPDQRLNKTSRSSPPPPDRLDRSSMHPDRSRSPSRRVNPNKRKPDWHDHGGRDQLRQRSFDQSRRHRNHQKAEDVPKGYRSIRHDVQLGRNNESHDGYRYGGPPNYRRLGDKFEDQGNSHPSHKDRKLSAESSLARPEPFVARESRNRSDRVDRENRSSRTSDSDLQTPSTPTVHFSLPVDHDAQEKKINSETVRANYDLEPMAVDGEEEDEDTVIERKRQARRELASRLTKEAQSPVASPRGSTGANHYSPAADTDASQRLSPPPTSKPATDFGNASSNIRQQVHKPARPVTTGVLHLQAPETPASSKDEDNFDMFSGEDAPKPKSANSPEGGPNRVATVERSTKEGYFSVVAGELLGNRYEVESTPTIGKGTFAIVLKAFDRLENRYVAIKIIRTKIKKVMISEADIIKKLNEADVNGTSHILRCFGTMSHRTFQGIVFEWMDQNLEETLKGKGYIKNRLSTCQAYAHQLFLALKFLKQQKLIHKDIKPSNVLVRPGAKQPDIRVCDFGTVARADDLQPESGRHTEHGTPFFRPPEVLLGWAHSYPYDMWTVGCTLFEVYTGEHFVQGNGDDKLLHEIINSVGMSQSFIRRSPPNFRNAFFDDRFNFVKLQFNTVFQRYETKLLKVLPVPIRGHDIASRILPAAREKGDTYMEGDLNLFADLLRRCLTIDPEKRITPEEALEHEFITKRPHPFMGSSSKSHAK